MHATHAAELNDETARTRRGRVEVAHVALVDELDHRRDAATRRELLERNSAGVVDSDTELRVVHRLRGDDDGLFRRGGVDARSRSSNGNVATPYGGASVTHAATLRTATRSLSG